MIFFTVFLKFPSIHASSKYIKQEVHTAYDFVLTGMSFSLVALTLTIFSWQATGGLGHHHMLLFIVTEDY